MSKSMSVQFSDGTSHTYDNVPDEVTQDQVNDRATQDFPDRTIQAVNEGAHPDAPQMETNDVVQNSSVGEQALAAGQTAAQIAAAHPYLAAGGVPAAVGLYKANKLANTWQAAKQAEIEAAKQIASQRAASMAGHQNIQQQKINLKTAQTAPVQSQGPQILDAQGRPMAPSPSMPSAVPETAPVAPQGAAQATQAVAQQAPTAENFLSRMAQEAKQYAPILSDTAGQVGKVAAPVLRFLGSAPVMGAQLMAHSGDLNTGEQQELARRQAMAPTITPKTDEQLMAEKHALERQQLANDHAQQWNRYKDAKLKALQQM